MFKLSIQADEEMRGIVRAEVKGAIITLTKAEIATQVAEGFRRIQGTNTSLEPFIQLQATGIIKQKVNESLNPGWGQQNLDIRGTAREYIKGLVKEKVNDSISEEIRAVLATIDIKDLVTKAISGLKFHAGS
jgi:hypothetical protein